MTESLKNKTILREMKSKWSLLFKDKANDLINEELLKLAKKKDLN